MLIAQISDTHLIVEGAGSRQRMADFRAAVADINALDPAADVIVHTGDIVHHGTPEEYAAAAEILAEALAPVYVLAGNKDNRANLRAAFEGRGYLPEGTEFITYAVDDFPVRLVMLDTVDLDSKKGAFCEGRFALLAEQIEQGESRLTAFFQHHPPFEVLVGPDRWHFDDRTIGDRLARTVSGTGDTLGVFCGHVHRLTAGKVGPAPALVASAVASELRYGEYPTAADARPIYFLHHIHAEGGFRTELRIPGVAPHAFYPAASTSFS